MTEMAASRWPLRLFVCAVLVTAGCTNGPATSPSPAELLPTPLASATHESSGPDNLVAASYYPRLATSRSTTPTSDKTERSSPAPDCSSAPKHDGSNRLRPPRTNAPLSPASRPAVATTSPQLQHSRSAEERVGAAAQLVTAYAHDHPGSGYSNVIVDRAAVSITVVWHGQVPASLRTRLATTDVSIRYTPAVYKLSALEHATQQLLTSREKFTALGVEVGFGPNGDGSGLNLTYDVLAGHPAPSEEALENLVRRVTGIPVTNISRMTGGSSLVLCKGGTPPTATGCPKEAHRR